MNSLIPHTVGFCARHAWSVILVALALAAGSGAYTARHFAIDTNINNLLSRELPWRQREIEYQAAYPRSTQLILVVVEAPTREQASAATRALAQGLSRAPDLFRSVEDVGGAAFFQRNGLLFLPTDQVARSTRQLSNAAPLLGALASDPSLRGLVQVLDGTLERAKHQMPSLDDLAQTLNMSADTLERIAAGQPAKFSWKVLLQGGAQPADLRRFIAVVPALDTSELEPGRRATDAIRHIADAQQLASAFQVTIRLTGPVPISDDEFATLKDGLLLNSMISALIVLAILWLALRSLRLVAAVVVTLTIGLVITAGLGLLLVGALNPVSMAFAVLFVGLGADFAIQFGVRYRAERNIAPDLHQALAKAGAWVGIPLTLAAAAAAAGFLSFTPTDYSGVAQLGQIAGCGMGVAYVASLTVLPALLAIAGPPKEPRPLTQPALAPVDHFLRRHRILIIAVTAVLTIAGLPALTKLQFDFNPLHLRNARSEAIATLLQLSNDPTLDSNSAQVLVGSHDEAMAVAAKLSALPEVARTLTIDRFVPADQEQKLPLIQAAARALQPALTATAQPAPSDVDDVAALRSGAQGLNQAAADQDGPGAQAARRLAADLTRLADAAPVQRANTSKAFISPLKSDLADLREALQAQSVTRASLPDSLVRDWVAPDGRERVDVLPKGDANDNATLQNFARAVLRTEPRATGQAVTTLLWEQAIITAFLQAAAGALVAIAILLWIALRRIGDVLLTLLPLVVAALATLEICALTGFALNYANIIALPVLLGVGVAFKIYYITAWRRGETDFMQSALTRAVFFSALLTATAFGSLWLSANPGMSSMGKLLALSLACTLVSAVLFQPALMGEPRRRKEAVADNADVSMTPNTSERSV
jgi:uncharacterized protein